MKIVKCLIAVAILVASLAGTILAPVPVNAAVIDAPIVEPQYSVIRCECGGTARFIRYITLGAEENGETAEEFAEFYCPDCKCYFYLKNYWV